MRNIIDNIPLGPAAPVGEILLAETAIRIELPPSLHRLAIERFSAIQKYVERQDSPLCNRVRLFYPQGSMAIRATIKSRKRGDGFDIDIVAELILSASMAPDDVLDLLFQAINGEEGALYYGKVERNSRCVTVCYEDGMHLDVTPSILVDERDPRRSIIFHAKAEESATKHRRLLMNSYAFVEWFNARTPIDLSFAEQYAKRALAFDEKFIRKDAAVKPVPAHSTTEGGKSAAVVAMQLLKRNRNLKYARRRGARMPPSVMIAAFTGEQAVPNSSISRALDAISGRMLAALEQAQAEGRRIDVRNPMCLDDRFTDRWPEDLAAQDVYIQDLQTFHSQLASLLSEELPLDKKRNLLIVMFGEGPARDVIQDYAAVLGKSVRDGSRRIAPSGRVLPASVAARAIVTPAAAQPRGHTFYGSRWRAK